ncbi:MAG: oligosaccharide flippase family protein [Pseudomonadota bacterium]
MKAWSEKGLATLADQSVVSATNFLTGVIVGRACTKEEFGLYMLGLTIVFFLVGIQTSLISTPYMLFSPHLKGSSHSQYTGSTLIHQFALSALAIFAMGVTGLVLSFGVGPQGLAPVVWTLVVVVSFIMLKSYVRQICFAVLKMKTAFLIDSCVAIVQVSFIYLLSYLGLLSASLVYWVVGIASGIIAIVWIISNQKAFTIRANHVISDFMRNWSSGKWVSASGLLWIISLNLYPWILVGFHGTDSAGVWAACLGIVALLNPLLLGGQNLLGPTIAHFYVEEGPIRMCRLILKASLFFSVPMMFFCTVLWAFGDPLVVLVYGDKYAGNGLLVTILALNLLLTAATFSFSRGLLIMKRADIDFAVNLAGLIILLTLGLWLVKAFGPLGAAYGLLVIRIVALVLMSTILIRLAASMSRGIAK